MKNARSVTASFRGNFWPQQTTEMFIQSNFSTSSMPSAFLQSANQHYQFVVIPFGLSRTPQVFLRFNRRADSAELQLDPSHRMRQLSLALDMFSCQGPPDPVCICKRVMVFEAVAYAQFYYRLLQHIQAMWYKRTWSLAWWLSNPVLKLGKPFPAEL